VGSIAVDRDHPQRIYVGTGDPHYGAAREGYGTGILRSDDGGNTFTLVSTGGPGDPFYHNSISKIIVDPTDRSGNTLYAAVVPWRGSSSAGAPGVPANQFAFGNPEGWGIWKSTQRGAGPWEKLTGLGLGQIGEHITVTDLDYTILGGAAEPRSLVLYAGV